MPGRDRFPFVFLLLTAALLVLQMRSGLFGPFDVDEFGLLQAGHRVCTWGLRYAEIYKLGGGVIACAVQQLGGGDAVRTLMAGRLVAFFYELGFLAALFVFTRAAWGTRAGALAVFLAATQFHFVDQGFRFRSELLTAALFLCGYTLLRARRELAAGLLMALAVAVHDKSVVLYLPALAFVARSRGAYARWLALPTLATVAVLGYAYAVFGFTPLDIVGKRVGNPSSYPFGSFYVQAAAHAWVFLVLAAGGLAAAGERRAWLWVAAAVGTVAAVFPAPFPFFFLLLLGPVAALAGRGADWLLGQFADARTAWTFALVIIVATAAPALARMQRNVETGNAYELALVSRLETYAEGGLPGYFDGMGMLVTQAQTHDQFIDHNNGRRFVQDPAAVPALTAELDAKQTAVVVVTRPLLSMPPPFRMWLKRGFVPDWGNFWVRGWTFKPLPQPVTFGTVVPGSYELLGTTAVEIDGAQAAPGSFVALSAGPHALRGAPGSPLVQLRLRPRPPYTLEPGPMPERAPFGASWALQWDNDNRGWLRW
jgi:hypothetical protein